MTHHKAFTFIVLLVRNLYHLQKFIAALFEMTIFMPNVKT